MSSIIEGYNYDIFISYRQKDNKYDGWVTEFVENLKHELDSMFKEEVSIYFDINPHDGLLETHEVYASLREKLKCLICIPIISRTYCDPKAFAWGNEFKAFIDIASSDQFGLKVKLQNGNVANRVLPVRIHDLDSSDVRLFESTMGGVLRPIDFIYKETGVNRQLRAKDDDVIKSSGHVLYRDQINKVALAAKEIIQSLMLQRDKDKLRAKRNGTESCEEAGKQEDLREEPAKDAIDVLKNTTTTEQTGSGETGKSISAFLKPKFFFPVFIIILVLTVVILLLNHRLKVKWANEKALSDIEKFYEESNYIEAYNVATEAEKYIPESTELKDWLSKLVGRLTILTDPPGADVFIKEYSDSAASWQILGKTPVDSLKMPAYTFYQSRIEKPGYETVYAVFMIRKDTISRRLFKQGTIPSGMVYVEEYWDEVKDIFDKDKGFFLDRLEVTNKQFKEFINKGGYNNRDYWKNEFIKDNKKLTWEEAIAEFKDKTGRPGPSTWEAGDYADGLDDYPVSGVSWYEAAAYAEYAGKVLPTGDHWDSGMGFYRKKHIDWFHPKIYPLSNFKGKGPERVGKNQGMTAFGALDMAGNVREWCWNESSQGRIVAGAGYSDPTYMFTIWEQLPPFDRSPLNGFRCATYIDRDKIPETAFRFIDMSPGNERDCSLETPVPESVFRIYKNQFLYDKNALNAVIEKIDESTDDWIMEKITFDAAYDNQRMIAYLFLPRNASPPFQTLIFFPGSYAVYDKELTTGHFIPFLDFVLKSGRAAVYPVYFRTYERNDGITTHSPRESHQYTELLIKLVKDFSRTIDYLESRADIDTGKLGYYGHSWGGQLGAIIPAVEDRLSINILVAGGFPSVKPYPEADEINYISRVKVPTLMLNGRYDAIFPLDNNVSHFFRLLETPEADKRLCVIDAGHNFPKSYMIREILYWCDKYLGPVKQGD